MGEHELLKGLCPRQGLVSGVAVVCGGIWGAPFTSVWDPAGQGSGTRQTKIPLSGPGTEQRDVHNQAWPRPPEDRCFPLFDSTLKRTGCSYLTALIIGKDL